MKKEQILELMNALPPDLVEEADIQTPVKRRFSKGVRGALTAACLCLALVGTTFAAVRYFWVEVYSGREFAGYKVYGEFTKFPVDSFSTQLLADCENGDVSRKFDTWEEAKAYLGDGIPWIWPEQTFPFAVFPGQSPIRLSSCLDRDNDNKLQSVYAFCSARYIDSETGRQIEPKIQAYIPTENLPIVDDEKFGSMGGGFYGYSGFTVEHLEDYPMSNGVTAGIVRVGYPLEKGPQEKVTCYEYIGIFVKDSIRYEVTTTTRGIVSPDSPEDIEADLKTILDLFP